MNQEIQQYIRTELGTQNECKKFGFGDQSEVYIFKKDNQKYFIKIAEDLKKEHSNLLALVGVVQVPQVIGFKSFEDKDVLITKAIEGKNLAELSEELAPEVIVNLLVIAVKDFHNKTKSLGETWVHGDACLPNFIFDKDFNLAGYIDLGDARIESVEEDLSAAIWSLEKNIGKGFGELFLREYGYSDMSEEKVYEFWKLYEGDGF